MRGNPASRPARRMAEPTSEEMRDAQHDAQIDTRIAGDRNLTSKLKGTGFAPDQVIAAGLESNGAASLFVNK